MSAANILNGTCVTCGNSSSHFDRQECECDSHPEQSLGATPPSENTTTLIESSSKFVNNPPDVNWPLWQRMSYIGRDD
jgi:hypothetical protein